MIAFRSLAWFGLITFVPLWEVAHGHSKAYGGRVLAIMLLAGGIGTLLLGPIADRIGNRTVLIVSQALVGPLVLVFVFVGGIPGVVALSLIAACVVGTFGVTMVLSQVYLPRHIGMASGLTIGLSIGLGGVGAVALGAGGGPGRLPRGLCRDARSRPCPARADRVLPRPRALPPAARGTVSA